MEHGYSILMGLFSAALLIYAALMAVTKDYDLLPYRAQVSVSPKDPELYMVKLAKCVALTALAPALSALVGLWNNLAAFVVLVAGIVFFLWLSVRIMKDQY
jgi:hypothetical protein